MRTKRFNEFKYNESNDNLNYQELYKKWDDILYESNKLMQSKWKKSFFDVIKDDLSYRHVSYSLHDNIQEVETNRSMIEDLTSEVIKYTKVLDNKYEKEGDLSQEDDLTYNELDDYMGKFQNMEEKLTEFRDSLKKVSDTYLTLEESIDEIRGFK